MNLTEATIRALNGELVEARSHKEDNERVAPRRDNKDPYDNSRVYGEIYDVPKRARYGKNNSKGWGYYDNEENFQYKIGISQSIQDYKTLKNDAESERHIAHYHNALAQQSDDEASDIVRNKKLARVKNTLQGKQVFNVTEDLVRTNIDSTAFGPAKMKVSLTTLRATINELTKFKELADNLQYADGLSERFCDELWQFVDGPLNTEYDNLNKELNNTEQNELK